MTFPTIANRLFYLLIFIFFIQTTNFAQQQRFKAGLNVGLTAAQINGDESAEFNKLGLTAGIRAYTFLNDKSDILLEILFSQRGSRTKVLNGTTIPQKIIQLNYIEVPIIYTIKDGINPMKTIKKYIFKQVYRMVVYLVVNLKIQHWK